MSYLNILQNVCKLLKCSAGGQISVVSLNHNYYISCILIIISLALPLKWATQFIAI